LALAIWSLDGSFLEESRDTKPGVESNPKDFNAYGDGASRNSANLLLRMAKLMEASPAFYVIPASVRRLNRTTSKRQSGAWIRDMLAPHMGMPPRRSCVGKRREG
jgi:hypothetical protein